ncbi:MAG TPA: cytochrome c biogenesis protein CcdA [archaeon]|nr:cytochrome c biogenesis protein CcdA [archaeon]
MASTRMKIILSSIFFVLGFSAVFSLLGVLLQGVLSGIAYDLRTWLGYIGGAIIIFFGLFMLGLIKIDFLMGEHKLSVKKTNFQYLSSFLFGAAFAVGWTPCVGAVLGSVLTLAVTRPEFAFPLMLSYSIGLGVPFIIAAIFISQATGFIRRLSPALKWFNLVFGVLLVVLGLLVATGTLNILANLFPVLNIFFSGAGEAGMAAADLSIFITFLAGLASFFSPCILPLVPAYLTFIAGTTFSEVRSEIIEK